MYPIGVNDPDDGERSVVVDPATSKASPLGWHDQGNGDTFTTTIGNNVYAQENWSGSTGSGWVNNYRPDAGASLNFDYPINFNQDPEEYIDAAVSNLFYWNNVIHDILYEYGFDEVSGNFQENNFANGGLGADAVQANAQDGAGYNNANFATPPDGERPRMRMYVWTTETPYLDGDLDNGAVQAQGNAVGAHVHCRPKRSHGLGFFFLGGGRGGSWFVFAQLSLRSSRHYHPRVRARHFEPSDGRPEQLELPGQRRVWRHGRGLGRLLLDRPSLARRVQHQHDHLWHGRVRRWGGHPSV